MKGTNKPLAAPVLRRDQTAQEKLAVLAEWNKACDKEGVDTTSELRTTTKAKHVEAAHHRLRACMVTWRARQPELDQPVAGERLGNHGVRPIGSARTL